MTVGVDLLYGAVPPETTPPYQGYNEKKKQEHVYNQTIQNDLDRTARDAISVASLGDNHFQTFLDVAVVQFASVHCDFSYAGVHELSAPLPYFCDKHVLQPSNPPFCK